MQEYIIIKGARENNLKNINVKIPKKQITVFTGVSGSGKSSLCLDTIAAESRRELNETFPVYVQHHLPKYGRPNVEKIEKSKAMREHNYYKLRACIKFKCVQNWSWCW